MYEAVKAGGVQKKIAERFGVCTAVISKVMTTHTPTKKGEEKPVLPAVVVEALASVEEGNISFEGEFLVIKVPKKLLTRSLLKDVL